MPGRRLWRRGIGVAGLLVTAVPAGALAAASLTGGSASASSPQVFATAGGCNLGNGVQHVIEILFDNVHYNRDNPSVPSDLEQLPALMDFITGNGTLNTNSHTPLIAHTADDSLTDYTGLYGDRQGMGVSNDYETYNPGNTSVDSAGSFAYWTDPINDTSFPTTAGHDVNPSLMYSATVPAQPVPNSAGPGGNTSTPAPWVPFTRAGCNVGAVASANMELENPTPDIPDAFGASSPEAQQVANDTDFFKDQETNDYVGLGVHCAQGSAVCGDATAVKYGQTSPTPTAVPDVLPTEPGGYSGYQALFGNKYIAPVVTASVPNSGSTTTRTLSRAPGTDYLPAPASGSDVFPVTDAGGNLTDLFGNEMDGQYVHTPGFPGYGPITAAQSLAYTADLQEAGVPVTYTYISDLHEKKFYPTGYKTVDGSTPAIPTCTTAGAKTGYGLGPGDPCDEFNAQQDNAAFAAFFQRLADEGINKSNTLFVFAADEGDHFNGANAGRAITPTCTGMPGVAVDTATAGETPYRCTYPQGSVGEVDTSIHGLLAAQQGDSTASFYSEPQGDAIYVTGSSTDPRQLEHEFAATTVNDPFNGNANTPVVNYMADTQEEALLHIADADPARTPTFTVFPDSEIYMSSGTSDSCTAPVTSSNANSQCVFLNNEYLWNHGYYAPEVDTTWLGFVGPGVANNGVDGFSPGDGPNSAGPASGSAQTVPTDLPGTWTDHTDTRPTIMYLTGLKDDYTEDGRVITEDLAPSAVNEAMRNPEFGRLATCYKQLDASVGQFANDTLAADTAAIESNSAGDNTYSTFSSELSTLGGARDRLATTIKDNLWNAEFNDQELHAAGSEIVECQQVLAAAANLASGGTGALPPAPAGANTAVLLPVSGSGLIGAWSIRRRRAQRRGRRPLA